MDAGVSARSRTVEIDPNPLAGETGNVLRALFHIGYWTCIVVGFQVHAPAASGDTSNNSAPAFVQRFADLDARDQRAFRAVQEGIGEAERRRARLGAWPKVEDLAADGIPPFAADPIDKDPYTWTLRTSDGVANYVGTPVAGSTRRSMVVIFTEPPKGSTPDASTPVDEVHHRLTNGLLVHVGLFIGPGLANERAAVPSVDFGRGWQQILSGPTSVLGR
jgi:hypothetical protein